MRLLHATTLTLHEFSPDGIPPYAILSHTWGDEEVTLQELCSGAGNRKRGYSKIANFCDTARDACFEYCWVDTCCIDKTSSTELSEAINSMFQWYRDASVCYAYLEDVPVDESPWNEDSSFRKSRWFTRGWTLQELIAPAKVIFFSREWDRIGSKNDLKQLITSVTGIGEDILTLRKPVGSVSIARRMSWASSRITTRPEDIAYCLLGIFNIRMPLLYGEGKRAFARLQEEIMKGSDDHTIFAWKAFDQFRRNDLSGLLASSPNEFADSSDIVPFRSNGMSMPYSMTNKGLQIQLPLLRRASDGEIQSYIAVLECRRERNKRPLAIELVGMLPESEYFARSLLSGPTTIPIYTALKAEPKIIFVKATHLTPENRSVSRKCAYVLRRWPKPADGFCLVDLYPKDDWNPEDSMVFTEPDTYGNSRVGFRFQDSNGRGIVIVAGYTAQKAHCWCNIEPENKKKSLKQIVTEVINNPLPSAGIEWKIGKERLQIIGRLTEKGLGSTAMFALDIVIRPWHYAPRPSLSRRVYYQTSTSDRTSWKRTIIDYFKNSAGENPRVAQGSTDHLEE
ncbi:HET-domain-containing protein [Cenococcum geophilum 1.58]|uniref:HET-domain-containing protein n=1 Tax=Cenococcum geophilum 1.58 TaxID=794803 RepID=UPI00358F7253|nr:HET-domain-containing protein [Cenococcum geophilum 1.58]